jgi:hypothetical protein
MLVKPMHTQQLLQQIDRLMESHSRKAQNVTVPETKPKAAAKKAAKKATPKKVTKPVAPKKAVGQKKTSSKTRVARA